MQLPADLRTDSQHHQRRIFIASLLHNELLARFCVYKFLRLNFSHSPINCKLNYMQRGEWNENKVKWTQSNKQQYTGLELRWTEGKHDEAHTRKCQEWEEEADEIEEVRAPKRSQRRYWNMKNEAKESSEAQVWLGRMFVLIWFQIFRVFCLTLFSGQSRALVAWLKFRKTLFVVLWNVKWN